MFFLIVQSVRIPGLNISLELIIDYKVSSEIQYGR